jgi:hypothetical protein
MEVVVNILGKFGRFYSNLIYFTAIWSILQPFGLFYSHLIFLQPLGMFYGHLVYIVVIWCICSRFGMLHQEKSGNPDFGASSAHP